MKFGGKIKIVGVGEFGAACIKILVSSGLPCSDIAFTGICTDCEHLPVEICRITLTDCAGFIPAFRAAAMSRTDDYRTFFSDADCLIVLADVSGGCASAVAPFVASLAKKAEILTIGIACRVPWQDADGLYDKNYGIYEFSRNLDSFIQLRRGGYTDTQELCSEIRGKYSSAQAVAVAAVQTLFFSIDESCMADLDYSSLFGIFADNSSFLTVGSGAATGVDRVERAVNNAFSCAEYGDRLSSADCVLLNITLPPDGGLYDISGAEDIIAEICPDAEIYRSVRTDATKPDAFCVTAVFSGIACGSKL